MTSSTKTRVHGHNRSSGATRVSLTAALGVALLLGLPGRGQAYSCSTPSFAPHEDIHTVNNPGGVAVGDFNHDNKMDLVVANGNTNSVSVLLGDNLGGFAAPTDFTVGTHPLSVAQGDFNNDTDLDLAVVDFDGVLWVLLGDGLGGFGAPTGYPVGTQPILVVVGKFNNDNIPDLAVVDYTNGGEVSVLLGNGDGTFGGATGFPAGAFPLGMAAGDFNGDGRDDLAVANLTANTVSVLLSNVDGTFGTPNPFPVGTAPVFVAVGDFDGDLKQDLAVANVIALGVPGSVSVLRGDGTGGFGPPTNYPVGEEPVSVAVQDFNGDTVPDLVVANNKSSSLAVLLGIAGSGSFQDAVNFPIDHNPGSLAVGDFYGDGQMDVIVSVTDSKTLSLLLNACGYPVHDTVVLPVKPTSVTIPLSKPVVTKKLSVKVRNADTTHTPGYKVKLAVDDSDCGGLVAGTPDFLASTVGLQDIVQIADGKSKTAKVLLTFNSAAFTSYNRNAPHRCTLWLTSSTRRADGAPMPTGDPSPSNNSFPVELSITDLNDADQLDAHEATIASLKPITLKVGTGKPSKTANVLPKVGNADANEPQGDLLSATVDGGNCPIGTVGEVDFSTQSGIQSSATVVGGKKKSGKLPVTATNGLCTPNVLAPQRCIATVSVTGPGGNPDKDGSNNRTRLVIDMIDKNDISGVCVP